MSQGMIIINMKSFVKLLGQLLRFIAVSVTPEKYKSLCTRTQLNKIKTKKGKRDFR